MCPLQADLSDPGPTPVEYANFFSETRRCSCDKSGGDRLGSKKRSVEASKTFRPEEEEQAKPVQKFDHKAAASTLQLGTFVSSCCFLCPTGVLESLCLWRKTKADCTSAPPSEWLVACCLW